MLSIQTNTTSIDIGILEVSSQNRAILAFFFESSGAELFNEVGLDEASAFIIDYDFPGAKESWNELYVATKKPGIILSVHEVDVPNTVWLQKPLTAKQLISAASKINGLLNSNEVKNVTPSLELDHIATNKQQNEITIEKLHTEIPEVNVEKTITENLTYTTDVANSLASSSHFVAPEEESHDNGTNQHSELSEISEITKGDAETDKIDSLLNSLNSDIITEESTELTNTNRLDLDPIPETQASEETEDEVDALLNALNSESNIELISDDKEEDTAMVIDDMPNLQTAEKEEEIPNKESDSPLYDELELLNSDIITEKNTELTNNNNLDLNSISETQALKEEDEVDVLLNALSSESNSNIEFISDDKEEDTAMTIDAIPSLQTIEKEEELPDKESDSPFYDELVLDDVSEETSELEEIREDIVTISTDTSDQELPENLPNITTDDDSDNLSFSEQSTDSDLQDMLDEIQQEMGGHASTPNRSSKGLSSNTGTSEPQEYEATSAQDRWTLLCGDKHQIKNASSIKKDAFKLNEHLLAKLLEAIEEAKITQQVMRIKYETVLIIIDTEIDTIYSDTSIGSDEYANICFSPLEHDDVKMHSLDASEIRMMHKKLEVEPNNAYSIESFVWTTSLLTSRGRLLEHTNTNKIIGLKHWPNLTRIESFPHVMNIAAVFSKHPGSIMDVAKWLEIPQCYVFAFYNAAFSLNMIDLNVDRLNKNNIKKISFSFSKKDKSKNRGLFSRLLNKLKG